MYSKNEEDNKLIKDLIEKRDDLKSKKKQIYLERELLDMQISRLGKEIYKIHKELKMLCEHEWTRESYAYSELYCAKCGVYK
jgi:hypothetical protein|tara:strand:- start:5098 stop:5343 length:246 start_codon:yes stop_codon:yes gene_type:complete